MNYEGSFGPVPRAESHAAYVFCAVQVWAGCPGEWMKHGWVDQVQDLDGFGRAGCPGRVSCIRCRGKSHVQ